MGAGAGSRSSSVEEGEAQVGDRCLLKLWLILTDFISLHPNLLPCSFNHQNSTGLSAWASLVPSPRPLLSLLVCVTWSRPLLSLTFSPLLLLLFRARRIQALNDRPGPERASPWLSRSPDSLCPSCLLTPHPSRWVRGQLWGWGWELGVQVFSAMLPGQVDQAFFLSVPLQGLPCRVNGHFSLWCFLLMPLFVVTDGKCFCGEGQKSLHHVPSQTSFPMLPMSVWNGWPRPHKHSSDLSHAFVQ